MNILICVNSILLIDQSQIQHVHIHKEIGLNSQC